MYNIIHSNGINSVQSGFLLFPLTILSDKIECVLDVARGDSQVAAWLDDAVAEIQQIKAEQSENENIADENEQNE